MMEKRVLLSITSHHIFLTFHKQVVRYACPAWDAVARCAVPVPVE